jgi:hypothetical protein
VGGSDHTVDSTREVVDRVRIEILRRIRIDFSVHRNVGSDNGATAHHRFDACQAESFPEARADGRARMFVQ